jgi:hypothetical protein
MSPQKSSFSIYIDPTTCSEPLKKRPFYLHSTPLQTFRLEIQKRTDMEEWLKKDFSKVAPGFSRPTDPAWTLARLPERRVTLGALKKWQKNQPNDHTSKLYFIFSILSYFSSFYFPLYKFLIFINFFYRTLACR